MRLLLDSHAILWWSLDDPKLPASVKVAIADEAAAVFISVASIWEIAIKLGLGKLPEAERFIADMAEERAFPGFDLLAIAPRHAIMAGSLDIPHRDPFDRLLIAQARLEGLTLVSNEQRFDDFGAARLWA